MIRTENLCKHFGDFVAVDHLSLHVRPGEVYGFLGPNGAGKTTTILMLLGLSRPTAGSIHLFDLPLTADNYFAVKRRIGVVGETQYFYDDMTAREYLRFFAELYDVPDAGARLQSLMEALDLTAFLDTCARDYSRGMKQKLAFARALLPDPDLLILDEPVSGLDPYGIREVRQLIQAQNQAGKTVFISSHILSEVERTAHRVGIIHHGQLLAEDTIDGLRARLSGELQIELELAEPAPELPAALEKLAFVRTITDTDSHGRRFTAHLDSSGDRRAELSRAIVAHGGIIVAMQQKEISLEEAFVTITERDIPRLVGQGLEGTAP
ncbi:MAG: ABC transporter ATP-binding protein [Chloroflexota bacterium]